ncbi:hypothetical protein BDBG_05727 [Blastomyces gilchristii SLH14081]|uniref:Myb-like domain-containing protein n=1 Tax=Blastomyces gilchristii (strain SLH14081) TaxID=559298 RepID=A0A179UPN1_BLAGS|nr:uncharacterized protein BDBG_05727 [Blastomyces gilchristii SLH14081]OAT10046.1 hypothetical protein BDBG_05727 [Blastomyces gilchristii SLH14081]
MSDFTPLNKVEKMKFEDTSGAETIGDTAEGIKQQDPENGNPANGNCENETKANGNTAATPRKRARKAGAKKTNSGEGEEGQDESPTKKQRTPGKGGRGAASGEKPKVGARAMPTSYENASPEDKMLLRMKDEENRSWAEIRQAWEDITGEKVGGSTLCTRYARIKANFIDFTPEDEELLLRFKQEIEEKFENDKWRSVSEAIDAAGGKKYPPAAVQKRFKILSKNLSRMEIGQKVNDAEDSS